MHVSNQYGDFLVHKLGQHSLPVVEPALQQNQEARRLINSAITKARLSKARSATASLLIQLRRLDIYRHRREYQFHETRRWRFDLCWPSYKVAVEIQGMSQNGAQGHQGFKGFQNDLEKFSEAFALGWSVVPISHSMIANGEAAHLIAAGLRVRGYVR